MAKRKFVKENGEVKVRIISPGQGSSAYYEEAQLERDHPVFRGRPVFWNHQTEKEERERPEGDLTNLMGKVKETMYDKAGPLGPGAYGIVDIIPYYREVVEDLAPYAGLSIRAFGDRVEKQVGDKKKSVAKQFTAAKSVDFVTEAGAGGAAVGLLESARKTAETTLSAFREAVPTFIEGDGRTETDRYIEWATGNASPEEDNSMEMKEAVAALEASKAEVATLKEENKRLVETLVLREAQDIVAAEVAKETTLPEITRTRLVESLKTLTPLKEGKLDADALRAAIAQRVKDEKSYVEALKPQKITGMGAGPDDGDGPGKQKLYESMKRMHLANHKSPADADRLAKISAGL